MVRGAVTTLDSIERGNGVDSWSEMDARVRESQVLNRRVGIRGPAHELYHRNSKDEAYNEM